MKVDKLVLGDLQTNCYILTSGKDAIIIDPAFNASKIIDFVSGFNVKEILVTHHHFDHVGALEELENHFKLKHNSFHSSNFEYEVIKTPGHTSDSLTFYFKSINAMFDGDFVFYGTIGRYDFPESSYEDMINSLNLISDFDNDIILYPGHGEKTILGYEKNNFRHFM